VATLLAKRFRLVNQTLRRTSTAVAVSKIRERQRFVLAIPVRQQRSIKDASSQHALICVVEIPSEICRFLTAVGERQNLPLVLLDALEETCGDDRVRTVPAMYHLAHGILTAMATCRALPHLIGVLISSSLLFDQDVRRVIALRAHGGGRQLSAIYAQIRPAIRRYLRFQLILVV
jgi:hypothetical protein